MYKVGCLAFWVLLQMGIVGDKPHLNFQIHIPHLHFHHHHCDKMKELKGISKGCLAILVGQGEEEKRFVIPVIYINHPLFMQWLKAAEEEYRFVEKGAAEKLCERQPHLLSHGMTRGFLFVIVSSILFYGMFMALSPRKKKNQKIKIGRKKKN